VHYFTFPPARQFFHILVGTCYYFPVIAERPYVLVQAHLKHLDRLYNPHDCFRPSQVFLSMPTTLGTC
jgi:hypothetical protein